MGLAEHDWAYERRFAEVMMLAGARADTSEPITKPERERRQIIRHLLRLVFRNEFRNQDPEFGDVDEIRADLHRLGVDVKFGHQVD